MITGIEHIAVCSKNTKALTDWYVKMFGFKVVYDNGKGTYSTTSQGHDQQNSNCWKP